MKLEAVMYPLHDIHGVQSNRTINQNLTSCHEWAEGHTSPHVVRSHKQLWR